MEAIRCQGLSKRFGSAEALTNLDLAVPPGSVFGFLGPNGAGKSTTIRILVTLARPTAGDAYVNGFSVQENPSWVRKGIGYLPQVPAFPGWMSGRDFLRFQADLIRLPNRERKGCVEEALELVGLSDVAKRKVGGYSGGMKQRLGLTQALLQHPPVLVLDEPISALDPLGRREVVEILERLRGETTVFFSSHILADIDGICDHVAILDKGKLLVQETMIRLKERYAQPTFEIDIAGNAASLADALRRTAWMQEVDSRAGHLHVLVSDVGRAEARLPRIVFDAGCTLLRYEQVLPSLEEVFLRLVKREEAAA